MFLGAYSPAAEFVNRSFWNSPLAASRFLSSIIEGVRPTEPLAFVALPLALLTVALVASVLPARRAARVNPVTALRCD